MRMLHLPKKARSKLQERSVACDLHGKRQPLSGAGKHAKLDVSCAALLVEVKYTDKDSYSVKKGLLELVRREAAKQGKIGVLALDINGTTAYVVPRELMEGWLDG